MTPFLSSLLRESLSEVDEHARPFADGPGVVPWFDAHTRSPVRLPPRFHRPSRSAVFPKRWEARAERLLPEGRVTAGYLGVLVPADFIVARQMLPGGKARAERTTDAEGAACQNEARRLAEARRVGAQRAAATAGTV